MIEEQAKSKVARSCYGAFISTGLCASASGVVVTLLQQQYSLPYTVTGTLLAALSLGNLISALSCGLLAGRWGTRIVALLLSSGAAIGYFGMAITQNVILLWLTFFLVGVAKGGSLNNCSVLMSYATTNPTRSMNLMNAGFALGALTCPFIVEALSNEHLPFQTPFFALAALGLVTTFCFAAAPIGKELGRTHKENKNAEWGFLRTGRFWLLTGLLFFQQATEMTVTSMIVTYFKDTGLLSPQFSSYVMTLMWLVILVGRLSVAHISSKITSPFVLLILMSSGCLIAFILLIIAHSTSLALFALCLYSLSTAGIYPTTIAAAGNQLSNQSMGVMMPVACIGAVITPSLCGAAAQATDIRGGMAHILGAFIGMVLLAILCYKFIQPKAEKQ